MQRADLGTKPSMTSDYRNIQKIDIQPGSRRSCCKA
jgi:hypothetical protein